jgi:hypothetical protein
VLVLLVEVLVLLHHHGRMVARWHSPGRQLLLVCIVTEHILQHSKPHSPGACSKWYTSKKTSVADCPAEAGCSRQEAEQGLPGQSEHHTQKPTDF